MNMQDPHHMGFLMENVGKLIGGVVIVLIGGLKLFSAWRGRAELAQEILREKPVSHAELLECKISVNDFMRESVKEINANINALRNEMKEELIRIHERIDGKMDK